MVISRRNKRFLRLGVLAIIIFVVVQYVFIPFFHREMEIREKIQLIELTHEKYTKIVSQRNNIENKLNQLKRKKNRLDSKLLEANTTSLAAAKLQKTLEKISHASDLELKRVRVRKPEEIGDFISIPIELRFTTDLKRTTEFLKGIKKHNKLITISRLIISVKRRRKPKLLIVTIVVRGFMEEVA